MLEVSDMAYRMDANGNEHSIWDVGERGSMWDVGERGSMWNVGERGSMWDVGERGSMWDSREYTRIYWSRVSRHITISTEAQYWRCEQGIMLIAVIIISPRL